jgi:hypothetical protein
VRGEQITVLHPSSHNIVVQIVLLLVILECSRHEAGVRQVAVLGCVVSIDGALGGARSGPGQLKSGTGRMSMQKYFTNGDKVTVSR